MTRTESSLEAGLLAYWPFDSLENIGSDLSGNGHEGIAEGKLSCVPGRVGNALDVSGGDNFIRVAGDSDAFRFGSNDAWSMAGWLKANEASKGWQGVVTKSRDQGHWLGIWISGKAQTPEGPESFNGLIDEVRIYNRVLTVSEIAQLASQE